MHNYSVTARITKHKIKYYCAEHLNFLLSFKTPPYFISVAVVSKYI
jgi:hypothetical protein